MVRKYLHPSMVEVEKRPHKSHWIKSKHSSEIWDLRVKGSLFCLAKGQISQWISLLMLERGTLLSLIKAILAFDRCPNLKFQMLGWTTTLFTKLAIEKEFLEIDKLSSSKYRPLNSLPRPIVLQWARSWMKYIFPKKMRQ